MRRPKEKNNVACMHATELLPPQIPYSFWRGLVNDLYTCTSEEGGMRLLKEQLCGKPQEEAQCIYIYTYISRNNTKHIRATL